MNIKSKIRNIGEQVGAIKALYPQFKISWGNGQLKVIGEIQPTPRSCKYQFSLKYKLGELPSVNILSPILIKNEKGEDIPHLYPNGSLCLYRPLRKEFDYSNLMANTIIPWISLWLYYYEIWHVTGNWLGGGEHPNKPKPAIKLPDIPESPENI